MLKHIRDPRDGGPPARDVVASERRLRSRMSLPAAAARIMAVQYERVRATEKEVRAGTSIEAVHQMRVAIRRLRAALKLFRTPNTRDAFAPWANDLREIGGVLGAVRDMDVLADGIRRSEQHVPEDHDALQVLLAAIAVQRETRRAVMIHMLDGPLMDRFRSRFPALLEELEATPGRTLRKAAPRLLKRHLVGVRQAHQADVMTSTELHELRIRCKRLRYACEFVQDIYGDQLDAMIKTTTALQDALGDVHDADVAPEILLSLLTAGEHVDAPDAPASAPPLAAAALRLLVRRQQQRDSHLLQFRDVWEELPARVRATPDDDRNE